MIIELLGPPAAGKTTLAHALATALEKNGFDVQLIASSRPAEGRSVQVERNRVLSWCRTALAAPLSRAAKLVSAPALLAGARSDELTASLMDLMPPRTLLWSVRYRRFLSLLSRSWKMASTSDRIVIFDQGFLTALCSMALLAPSVDRSVIVRGLALIPRPNLLVRLDAPRETLEARLRARLGRQRRGRAMARIRSGNQVFSKSRRPTRWPILFREHGGRMMHVSSLDRRLLEKAVDRIVRAVAKSWNEEIDPVNRSLVERRRIVRVAR